VELYFVCVTIPDLKLYATIVRENNEVIIIIDVLYPNGSVANELSGENPQPIPLKLTRLASNGCVECKEINSWQNTGGEESLVGNYLEPGVRNNKQFILPVQTFIYLPNYLYLPYYLVSLIYLYINIYQTI